MKSTEKKRLFKLGAVFVAVLGMAGVVRPWESRRKPVVEMPPFESAVEAGTTPAAANAPEAVELVKRFVLARKRPAGPRPSRDPFFLPEETAAGASLAVLWKEEDAAAARAAAPPPTDVLPAVSPEVVERLRRLRLFGTVGSPESGAAVVEGIGRVSVGATVPGTPFLLRSIGPGVAVFAAGDVVIELSTPRPQGGSATSEKK